MNIEVLKFGQFKGQPVEVLADHPDYVEWLLQQPWFKQKYQAQYNIIINNFAVPNDTPEHNKLQAKFLSRPLIERLARHFFEWPNNGLVTISQPKFETEGWDVFVQVKVADFSWIDKTKNKSWTDSYYNLKDENGFLWGEDTGDVDKDYPSIKKHRLYFAQHCTGYGGKSFGIELKASLGEDFPSVLRQVKRHGNCDVAVVVVSDFNAVSVSFEQVTEMFMGDNIRLLKLSALEEPPEVAVSLLPVSLVS